ncbi:X-linked retinitis pigmentosa GTPase regulator [Plakobranchus ocellatus]|uniref:X-linked retinitis pigmentosa GTPase regulator n=1 Tax=Plakobranchus ocellatus TaxID=259542 RepID=A0AAV4AC25_9GAST|nr:X-linked retinitis pigmentosa GTPase regulator [Plakobranchus ocellatus]
MEVQTYFIALGRYKKNQINSYNVRSRSNLVATRVQSGDVYVWGFCKGCGHRRNDVLSPELKLQGRQIVQVAGGATHSLALTETKYYFGDLRLLAPIESKSLLLELELLTRNWRSPQTSKRRDAYSCAMFAPSCLYCVTAFARELSSAAYRGGTFFTSPSRGRLPLSEVERYGFPATRPRPILFRPYLAFHPFL